MEWNQGLRLKRKKKIEEFAHTLHHYLSPLKTTEGAMVESHLVDAVFFTTTAGITLAKEESYPVPRRNGCQPGDNFDPRLMIAEGIDEGSDEECQLVEAGGRIAMVLSPPFLRMYFQSIHPVCDVETVEGEMLSQMIIQKGKVLCYTMKEGKDGGKSVEISGV